MLPALECGSFFVHAQVSGQIFAPAHAADSGASGAEGACDIHRRRGVSGALLLSHPLTTTAAGTCPSQEVMALWLEAAGRNTPSTGSNICFRDMRIRCGARRVFLKTQPD